MSQCPSRCRPGVVPVIDDDRAVDNDVWDTDRELFRLGPRCQSFHFVRLKDGDVGLHAVAEDASIGDAQSLGRERGHLADSFGKGHQFQSSSR